MSGVRVLVGTRKGAFILTSDEKREQWDVNGAFLRDGKSIIWRARQPIRTGYTHPSRMAGSVN